MKPVANAVLQLRQLTRAHSQQSRRARVSTARAIAEKITDIHSVYQRALFWLDRAMLTEDSIQTWATRITAQEPHNSVHADSTSTTNNGIRLVHYSVFSCLQIHNGKRFHTPSCFSHVCSDDGLKDRLELSSKCSLGPDELVLEVAQLYPSKSMVAIVGCGKLSHHTYTMFFPP
jgi:hypothetical protein